MHQQPGHLVYIAEPQSSPALAHGVFVAEPGVLEDQVGAQQLDAYVAASGQPLAYVYLTNNWFYSRAFPVQAVSTVKARNAVPFVRLMLRSSDEEATGPDPLYSLSAIIAGRFDADLRAWGKSAGQVSGPVYAEYGTEVNGFWFGWNARWNGKAGAAQFVQAYRHIASVVRQGGGTNVRWVFHVAAQDDPQQPWNTLEAYYPGGDVVSVLGVSAYGAQTPQDSADTILSLRQQLDSVMPRLSALAPGKPVMLLEFGSAAGAAVSPQEWAGAALRDLTAGRWPALRGFSWWNSAWPNDTSPSHDTEMRLEEQPTLAAVFRRFLTSPRISSHLNLDSPSASFVQETP